MPWIMPTMSRPDNAREIIKRTRESGCKSKIVVFVNGQSHAKEYEIALRSFAGDNFLVYYSKENIGCIGALNKVFSWGKSDEPFFAFMADDEFLIDGNPDDIVNAAGDWNIAHGWENWNDGKRFHGYCVIGGKLARAIGYLAIPECWHHFGFDCMYEWLCAMREFGGGNIAKNILVNTVRVEHRHHKIGLSDKDSCYSKSDDSFDNDKAVFMDWYKNRMPEISERVLRIR